MKLQEFVRRLQRGFAGLALCGAAWSGVVGAEEACAGDPLMTRNTTFRIPFAIEAAGDSPVQSTAILFASVDGGPMEPALRVPATAGGFQFVAPADGLYGFAVRMTDSSGRVPGEAEPLTPELEVIVDTVAPDLNLQLVETAPGQVDVVWDSGQSKIAPGSVRLEYAEGANGRWQPIREAVDSTGRVSLKTQPGTSVSVRGFLTDLAGNEGSGTAQVVLAARPEPTATSSQSAGNQAAANNLGQLNTQQQNSSSLLGPNPFAATAQNATAAPLQIQRTQQTQPQIGTGSGPANSPVQSQQQPNPSHQQTRQVAAPPQHVQQPRQQMQAPPPQPRQSAPQPPPPQQVAQQLPAHRYAPPPQVRQQPPQNFVQPGRPSAAAMPAMTIRPSPSGSNTVSAHPAAFGARAANPTSGGPMGNVAISNQTYNPEVGGQLVTSPQFDLAYELEDVGPSGVSAVELFVTEDNGQHWFRYGTDVDVRSPMQVDARGEGTFGFAVRVRNGIGFTEPPPQPGETPSIVVTVDQTRPTINLGTPRIIADGRGRIQLDWQVGDRNASASPVRLEFSDSPTGPWTPLFDWQLDAGSYEMPVQQGLPTAIFFRLHARDAAGNVATSQTPQALVVDQQRPRARLLRVEPVSISNR